MPRFVFPHKPITLTLLAISGFSVTLCMEAKADQKAKDVVEKMKAAYNSAKSLEFTLTMDQSGKNAQNQQQTVNTIQKVAFQAPNRLNANVTMKATGGNVPESARNASLKVVIDGKSMYNYSSAQNMYAKLPAPAAVEMKQVFQLPSQIPTTNAAAMKLLPDTNVGGRPAFVVQISPVAPPNLTPEQKKQFDAQAKKIKQPMQLVIDKQNYTLYRFSMIQSEGKISGIVSNQKINGSIPASAFTFTPPKGAKLAPPPPPGGMAPGAPGGAGIPGGKQ